jgi:pyruvate/2-oxoglutarate dehydrogenase complex dihydrolipoamide acyltransferase (E2) component
MKSLDDIGTFDEHVFPRFRIPTLDTLAWGRRRHHIPILLELDVTVARNAIRKQKMQTGQGVSFTGWIVKCLAQAVSEHPHIHALRKGKRKLVLFHDVDVTVVVERAPGQASAGETLPMPYIIRKANEKSLADIHAEIRAAQQAPVTVGDVQVGTPRAVWINRLFPLLPKLARDLLVWRRLQRNPFLVKRMMGTVSVTALGMMSHGGIGWGIPIGIHPLLVAVGGIIQRAVIVSDRLVMREHLGLTVLFDHDVTDGAPVARFIERLQELMASGYALEP